MILALICAGYCPAGCRIEKSRVYRGFCNLHEVRKETSEQSLVRTMIVTEPLKLSVMTFHLSEFILLVNSLIISHMDTMYFDHIKPILPLEVLPSPLTTPLTQLHVLFS